ncbi:MAG: DMT family transporter [Rhodospirillales bacterium]|nr:DMT family transporter [Rhodospirillales bacterium]
MRNAWQGQVLAGMGLGALAYAMFSVHDAGIKWLVAILPVWQVVWVRSGLITAFCLLTGRTRLVERAIASPVRATSLWRGIMVLVAWLFYFTASRRLPLAQMTSLYFAAPLMVTVMAAPMLGERVSRGRWAAVALGFAGVMLASDPGGVRASLPAAMVLLAAALWAYGVILMRKVARHEPSIVQVFVTNACFFVSTTIPTLWLWHPMAPGQWLLLGGVAAIGGLAQFTLFEGARFAPASVLATVEYSSLIWAFLLGALIWGDDPTRPVLLGAALIVAAGVLLLAMERRSSA